MSSDERYLRAMGCNTFSDDEIAALLRGEIVSCNNDEYDMDYRFENGELQESHCGHGAGCFWTDWE
jgi:hypothetical protein